MRLLSTRTMAEDSDKNKNNGNNVAKHKNNTNESVKHKNNGRRRW